MRLISCRSVRIYRLSYVARASTSWIWGRGARRPFQLVIERAGSSGTACQGRASSILSARCARYCTINDKLLLLPPRSIDRIIPMQSIDRWISHQCRVDDRSNLSGAFDRCGDPSRRQEGRRRERHRSIVVLWRQRRRHHQSAQGLA